MKEFGADKNKHVETQADIQKRKEREQKEKDERRAQQQKEKEVKKQQFKIIGTIDDLQKKAKKPQPEVVESKVENEPSPKVEAEPSPKVEAEPSPKVDVESSPKVDVEPSPKVEESKVEVVPEVKIPEEKPVVGVNEEKPQPETTEETPVKDAAAGEAENADEGIYRISTPQDVGVQFKQVGFIDLNSLNSKTRPDRKSKAERKKERIEKQQVKANKPNGKDGSTGQNGQTDAQSKNQKKKRNRIKNERVDVNAAANENFGQNQGKKNKGANNGQQNRNNQNQQGGKKGKKNKHSSKAVELSDEDVAKQVRETLARLTSKQEKKGVKYRKEKREAVRERMNEEEKLENAESKILKLTEFVTVSELATMMDVPVNKVIGTCMSIGMMVSINQRLDAETINMVAEEFGFKTNYVSGEVSNAIEEAEDKEEDLLPRAPIITVMGHVDHGKTSLLDYIRKTNVIAGEAGGITQHIGAYNVKMSDGRRITFLDTPGHEAFTAMRARGAQVTDIAIIIIAADDAIMPQTKEAIAHAQAAGVPMVFAINKIDKPGANPDKIREQLSAMNLLVEDWGGKYQCQEISAKQGIGVEELMEKVLLVVRP